MSSNLSLKYHVPFQAQENTAKNGLIHIQGEALDDSVNQNRWQVPSEDLDFFTESLKGAQLRIDHTESVLSIVGKVTNAVRIGNKVNFEAEVSGDAIIEKIIRGYLDSVSAQVDSENVVCSKCFLQSRKAGVLVHLCDGAWEIVHEPKVRELSIVASPAYANSKFKPLGFASAMDQSQNWNQAKADMQDLQEFQQKLQAVKTAVKKKQEKQNELEKLKKLGAKVDVLAVKIAVIDMQKDADDFKNKACKKAAKDPAQEDFEIATRLDEIYNGDAFLGSLLNPLKFREIQQLGLKGD